MSSLISILIPSADRLEKPEWTDAIWSVTILDARENFSLHHRDEREERQEHAEHRARC